MSYIWCDNVHTTAFTPRDYQVELLAAAYERNIMVCLGHKSSKEFIALKLIQELAFELRRNHGEKFSVYLTRNEPGDSPYNIIQNLTDLNVLKITNNQIKEIPTDAATITEGTNEESGSTEESKEANNKVLQELENICKYQVLILSNREFSKILHSKKIRFDQVNLLIIEDCHEIDNLELNDYTDIFEFYKNSKKKTRILGLAGPLHSADTKPGILKGILQLFEAALQVEAETASDIVTVLRYCTKPAEYIIQCLPPKREELVNFLEEIIITRLAFLEDHRYDLSEIYSEEFLEELIAVPDPKIEPIQFLKTYLDALHEMGPWCADRVALNLLTQIEKQKVKIPYERHFLLLCLVSTTLVEVRAYMDYLFQKLPNEKDRIEKYSTPKVLRLLEILKEFKPPKEKLNYNERLLRASEEINNLDFRKLQADLENTYQNIENENFNNRKRAVEGVMENLENIIENLSHTSKCSRETNEENGKSKEDTKNDELQQKDLKIEQKQQRQQKEANTENTSTFRARRTVIGRHKRKQHSQNSSGRSRFHGNSNNGNNNSESDALYGLIYCNSKYTAKVLFDLLCEMSRNDPELKFLSVQYTVDRIADPITEPKEAELEHRRQEEVLKRFRMHECNLLIGTGVLEEGIDLPKCNLVIRWDPPDTYRSYVQCKGRARAMQAHHIMLVAPKIMPLNHEKTSENLSRKSHRYLCSQSSKDKIKEEKYIANRKEESSDLSVTSDENLFKKENYLEQNGSANENSEEKSEIIDSDKPRTIIEMQIENNQLNSPKDNKIKGEENLDNNEKELNSVIVDIKKCALNNGEDSIENQKTFTQHVLENTKQETLTENDVNESSDDTPLETDENESESLKKIIVNGNSIESHEDSNTDSFSSTGKEPTCCISDEEETDDISSKDKEIQSIEQAVDDVLNNLAQYREMEMMLLEKCANAEPLEDEHQYADIFTPLVQPYKPIVDSLTGASVDLSSAIALINKYCAKLPSDTFTKLTPIWRCAKTIRNGNEMYLYTLRMPINSPLKHDIMGLPMPTKVLARRMVALIACRELHRYGELDNNLQPIGKEGFKAFEPDWEDFELEKLDEQIVNENAEPRPGTTKRRQYYYKRIASEFSNCRPVSGKEAYLYLIKMTLQCPIPEEQNTRGRRIYPPEEASQGFGILTLKKIPKISSFPIFTRSGEVKVAIELSQEKVILTDEQILKINTFGNYTFTNVLRLQKYLMLFDPEAMENCIYIVPTIKLRHSECKQSAENISIDWDFLELIYKNHDKTPRPVPDDQRKDVDFDPNRFKDAVVMPWYRNQDQPQYFYVAEICYHLSPESCFPGENYRTFQEYYFLKYSITIQNTKQPLLDVDHTSARLNFLTPRYVNRKGVALPTSSEETKRAKRENLEQKQILVPELCTIHPFPASLWRAAVCLPCILYRINGLLLADEIRKKVSYDIGLGRMEIREENFEWPMLDFGWSLAEVLRKSREAKQVVPSSNIDDSDNITAKSETDNETENNKSRENENEDEKNKKPEDESGNKNQPDIEKTANDILQEADDKLKNDCLLEIGTWSNDMANNIDEQEDFDGDEEWGILPPNVNLCSRNMTNIRYGSPTSWDYGGDLSAKTRATMDNYYPDSDASYQSDDDDYDLISTGSSDSQAGPLRIEFKSNNVAEAIETEEELQKMRRQQEILENTHINEKEYQNSKNLSHGFNVQYGKEINKKLTIYENQYLDSIKNFKKILRSSDMIISTESQFKLYAKKITSNSNNSISNNISYYKCSAIDLLDVNNENCNEFSLFQLGLKKNQIEELRELQKETKLQITIEYLLEMNLKYLKDNGEYEIYTVEGSGEIFDNFNDSNNFYGKNGMEKKKIYFNLNESNSLLNKCTEKYKRSSVSYSNSFDNVKLKNHGENKCLSAHTQLDDKLNFSFDHQPNLIGHPGPSPSIILQALTMSNANDGINLERLETIGDSFLKYAITTYLYCTYEDVHEGKLSHLRSKQVSNLNLYRLGRKKVLGECMIATKFEPHDNWLPPCYYIPKELEKALIEAKIPPCHWNLADLPNIKDLSSEQICELVKKKAESLGLLDDDEFDQIVSNTNIENEVNENFPCFIPYNLVTQHSIPDKSVADCVEALIGAYLIECGPRGALLFMAWLGIRVLPITREKCDKNEKRIPGSTQPDDKNEITVYGEWKPPESPLLKFSPNSYEQLEHFLDGYEEFERSIGYNFRDRSYLLQAMTHASYTPNRLTDCYQRLEFLGDAVLDYLITRHLYEDARQHSPGALTDLRSALVNNTIFASLAVRHGFHKYFKHLSPGLNEVIDRFVRIQHENGHSISEEYYLLSEEECDDAEDVEVPKALGDVFESVAGAIFLDSNMSLDTVWKVYSNMMRPEIEQFSNSVPKSPIRELLELEPETAKFGKPEKLADGRRVRVTVEVFGKGTFRGIGRNYRIAKCTAAKCALRQLKKQGLITKKH